MEQIINATEARVRFGELMRRVVEKNERFIVERGGKRTVVVLSVKDYERLGKGDQEEMGWQALVAQARARIQDELGDRELPDPDEILRQIRGERDEQLVDLR